MNNQIKFEEANVETFMGGYFKLDDPRTVGQLKKQLQGIITELDGWGADDQMLSECLFHSQYGVEGELRVTLADGIVQ